MPLSIIEQIPQCRQHCKLKRTSPGRKTRYRIRNLFMSMRWVYWKQSDLNTFQSSTRPHTEAYIVSAFNTEKKRLKKIRRAKIGCIIYIYIRHGLASSFNQYEMLLKQNACYNSTSLVFEIFVKQIFSTTLKILRFICSSKCRSLQYFETWRCFFKYREPKHGTHIAHYVALHALCNLSLFT